jgi:hypothetical protein
MERLRGISPTVREGSGQESKAELSLTVGLSGQCAGNSTDDTK